MREFEKFRNEVLFLSLFREFTRLALPVRIAHYGDSHSYTALPQSSDPETRACVCLKIQANISLSTLCLRSQFERYQKIRRTE